MAPASSVRESAMDALKQQGDGAKNRRRSEPHSLHAWNTVLFGSRRHHHPQGAPSPITAISASTLIMTPDEVYGFNATSARFKHDYPLPKLVVLGILAGAYIGLGFSLCCLVGGLLSYDFRHEQPGVFNLLFGVFGFPMGLTLCVVAGADLFTSNCMYTVIGVSEGKYGLLGALRTLVVSYVCNLAGALMLVGLMSGGEVFANRSDFVIELAHKKVGYSFGTAFTKGILCNWLVCLAVWQGNMARDLTGKFVGIFLPNSAFVSMGFEHSVANMFLIPMSMALGSDISVGTFLTKNLIPVTLGNIVGGSFFVGAMYALALGTPGHAIQDAWEERIVHSTAMRRAAHCCAGDSDSEEEQWASPRGHGHGHGHGNAATHSRLHKGQPNGDSANGDLSGLEDGDRLAPLPQVATRRY